MQTLITLFDQIWERRAAFLAVFFGMFLLSYGVLFAMDFVPETPTVKDVAPQAVVVAQKPEHVLPTKDVARYPDRIVIEKLGTNVPVLNPRGSTIPELDAALLEGVVRHPGSADFVTTGTIFLFGHSSYLPIVHNKNFQDFNGIQKLVEGDEVRLISADTEYVYHVREVSKVVASQTTVTLDNSHERLILVTCNSFGSKDDRFMVEADLVEKRAL